MESVLPTFCVLCPASSLSINLGCLLFTLGILLLLVFHFTKSLILYFKIWSASYSHNYKIFLLFLWECL